MTCVLYQSLCKQAFKISAIFHSERSAFLCVSLTPPCVCPHPAYEALAPPPAPVATAVPVWQDRTIASSKLRMLEYSAFMEVPQDQETVSRDPSRT